MKLKFWAAAAAVLCGTNAFAAINTVDNNAEVWAMVWDDSYGTYALDLGVTKGDLLSGAALGNLGAAVTAGNNGKAWSDFVAADKDGATGTNWVLFAIDNAGDIFDQGSLNIMFSTPGAVAPKLLESDVEATIGSLKTLTGNFGLNVNPQVQGDAYNAAGTAGHFTEGGILQGSWGVASPIGAVSSVFNCTDSGEFGSGPATCSAGLSQVSFNGERFSAVAVVPEASTYAMLLAGLLTVGFAARRRRN